MNPADPKYPLGTPLNRKPPVGATPVAGRPNWWQGPNGRPPFYVEPTKADIEVIIPQAPEKVPK